jgi:hypothetical protein
MGEKVLCAWSLLLCFQSVDTKKEERKENSFVSLSNNNKKQFVLPFFYQMTEHMIDLGQGILTEGEGLIQLTSLEYLVQISCFTY